MKNGNTKYLDGSFAITLRAEHVPAMNCYAFRPEPRPLARMQPESELSRFSVGGQARPPLWDVVLRGLQPPPEEEERHLEEDLSPSMLVKRCKTNSERGRAFRARRKKYEDDLETVVSSLRQEVADLGFLRGVRADKVLHRRNSLNGSLVRLANEYFALFARGMPSVRVPGQKRPQLTDGAAFESKQKAFLESAMDPELQFGGVSGPEALLDQWKKYSSFHASINVDVVGVEVSGEEENPMVTVRSDLHVVFSRATFDHVFPHVANNEELVDKFVGREVVYHGVNRFQFSPQGQILIYDSDVGFVDALVQAGASVSDIALLMQQAKIADECRLGDEGNNCNDRVQEIVDNQEVETFHDNGTNDSAVDADSDRDASSENGGRSETRSPEPSRFAIDFLLS